MGGGSTGSLPTINGWIGDWYEFSTYDFFFRFSSAYCFSDRGILYAVSGMTPTPSQLAFGGPFAIRDPVQDSQSTCWVR